MYQAVTAINKFTKRQYLTAVTRRINNAWRQIQIRSKIYGEEEQTSSSSQTELLEADLPNCEPIGKNEKHCIVGMDPNAVGPYQYGVRFHSLVVKFDSNSSWRITFKGLKKQSEDAENDPEVTISVIYDAGRLCLYSDLGMYSNQSQKERLWSVTKHKHFSRIFRRVVYDCLLIFISRYKLPNAIALLPLTYLGDFELMIYVPATKLAFSVDPMCEYPKHSLSVKLIQNSDSAYWQGEGRLFTSNFAFGATVSILPLNQIAMDTLVMQTKESIRGD